MSEFAAALVGAVAGGVLTFFGVWWQTKRVLAHETEKARAAAENARREARHSVSRMAVLELLPVLAQAEVAAPNWGRRDSDAEILDRMAEASAARAPLLPDAIQKRWGYLHTLAVHLHSAVPVSGMPDRADWTEAKIARARGDLLAYMLYVRRSLLALINEQELPPDAPMPYLRRVDMAEWIAPDEGGPTA